MANNISRDSQNTGLQQFIFVTFCVADNKQQEW